MKAKNKHETIFDKGVSIHSLVIGNIKKSSPGEEIVVVDNSGQAFIVYEENRINQWPLSSLVAEFGASFSHEQDFLMEIQVQGLYLNDDWQVVKKGKNDMPVIARREYGKGKIVLISSLEIIRWNNRTLSELKQRKLKLIEESVTWTAQGLPPAGGSLRLPKEAGGGGAIYPELEHHIGNVIMYYTKNQKKELLSVINEDMPKAKKMVEEWLPSKPLNDKMYLILSSGGGGGWAVNAYEPKEVGIISIDRIGVLAVFDHELAHTMGGPPNDKGELTGRAPHGD